MASREFNLFEKDVLSAALNNKIKYLTYYEEIKMNKTDYIFRPINVPTSNKWLRRMASDF